MKKIGALFLIVMFLMTGLLVSTPGITQNAKATTITSLTANIGFEHYQLNNGETNYQDVIDGVNGTLTTDVPNIIGIGAGQHKPDSFPTLSYSIYRGVIGLNCSSIDKSFVAGFRLYLKTLTPSWYSTTKPVGDINVYSRPSTETTFNWTNFGTNMTFVGQLTPIIDLENSTWYSINVPASAISSGDWSAEYGSGVDTVFYIVSSREGTVATVEEYTAFDVGDTPYLVSTEKTNGQAVLSYYTDPTNYGNITIMPVERMEYNNTYDVFEYNLYIFNYTTYGIDWMVIHLDPSFNYISNANFATVTNLGGGSWNITNYFGSSGVYPNYPPYYLDIWFANPIDAPKTEVSIQLWHSTLGQGILWEQFAIYASTGTIYNSSIANRIVSPTSYLEPNTYTFSVQDFFGNNIITHTAVISGGTSDVLIQVPVYQVSFNSFRNDTTAFAIYFNSTGTPYQDHCSGSQEVKMAIREGAYMFRFDYMASNATGFNTLISTYYYNLTINTTLTINFGTDGISILSTSINGNTITLNTIENYFTPSQQNIYYLLPGMPVGGGTRSSLSASELAFVWRHPYKITEADVNDVQTGTQQYFDSQIPTNGTVRWKSDYLYITGDNDAWIFINSTTANLVNYTGNPGLVDLTGYNEGNISLWSNVSMNSHRVSEFRQVQIFFWQYYPETLKYTIGQTITNVADNQWTNVNWFLGFATNDDGDIETADTTTIRVYDVDNDLVLDLGNHYDVSQAGIELYFDYLNTTNTRSMQFTYYLDNRTEVPQSTPIITIRQYDRGTWNGISMYQGNGLWVNERTATYLGDIAISLKNLQGPIDPNSVVVYDVVNDITVPTEYFYISSATISLNADGTGEVANGEVRQYEVYFLYEETKVEPFFLFTSSWSVGWVQITAHLLIFIFAIVSMGYGVVEMVVARREKTEAKAFGYILIGTFLFLSYILLWILHSMGIL